MKLTAEQIKTFDEQGYVFFPNCFADEEVAVLGTRKIRADGNGFPAGLRDRVDRFVDRAREAVVLLGFSACADGNGRAFGGEPLGDLFTDATAGTGDDGDLPL